jgi:hypothetical protein
VRHPPSLSAVLSYLTREEGCRAVYLCKRCAIRGSLGNIVASCSCSAPRFPHSTVAECSCMAESMCEKRGKRAGSRTTHLLERCPPAGPGSRATPPRRGAAKYAATAMAMAIRRKRSHPKGGYGRGDMGCGGVCHEGSGVPGPVRITTARGRSGGHLRPSRLEGAHAMGLTHAEGWEEGRRAGRCRAPAQR